MTRKFLTIALVAALGLFAIGASLTAEARNCTTTCYQAGNQQTCNTYCF